MHTIEKVYTVAAPLPLPDDYDDTAVPFDDSADLPLDVQHLIADTCIQLFESASPHRDTQFLYHLCLVSRAFQSWIEPTLYKFVQIRDEDAPRLFYASISAIQERPGAFPRLTELVLLERNGLHLAPQAFQQTPATHARFPNVQYL